MIAKAWKSVAGFGSVVVEEREEEVRIVVDLEDAAAVGGYECEEVGAGFLRGAFGHG